MLLTGKVKEAVTRRHDGRRVYDAVVLDAPPTGRIGRFLNVTAETARLAKVGPIKTQSEGVAAVLRSPMTAVHVVTLLEEMPVQETADAIAELTEAGLPVGSVIVNVAAEPLLPADGMSRAAEGRLTGAELAAGLAAADLRRRGRSPTRWPPRPPSTPGAGPEDALRADGRGAGPPDGRAAAAARPDGRRAAVRARRPARGPPAQPRSPPERPHRARGPAGRPLGRCLRTRRRMDVDRAARRPGDPDHRLLRLRRRGQDDHGRRARRCARPRHGRHGRVSPSTRPAGWPSRSA